MLGAVCPGAHGAGALGTLPLCACATWVRSPGRLPGLRLSTRKQGSIRTQKSRRPARPGRERGCVGRASGGQAGARPHAGGSPAASLRDGARPVRVARAGSAAACGQLTRRARGGAARRDGGGEDREPRRRRGPPHGRAAREPALRQHPAPQRRVHLQGAPAPGAPIHPNQPAGRARSSALWWQNVVSDRKARRQGAPAVCRLPDAAHLRIRRAAYSARSPSVEASACRAAARFGARHVSWRSAARIVHAQLATGGRWPPSWRPAGCAARLNLARVARARAGAHDPAQRAAEAGHRPGGRAAGRPRVRRQPRAAADAALHQQQRRRRGDHGDLARARCAALQTRLRVPQGPGLPARGLQTSRRPAPCARLTMPCIHVWT